MKLISVPTVNTLAKRFLYMQSLEGAQWRFCHCVFVLLFAIQFNHDVIGHDISLIKYSPLPHLLMLSLKILLLCTSFQLKKNGFLFFPCILSLTCQFVTTVPHLFIFFHITLYGFIYMLRIHGSQPLILRLSVCVIPVL